MASVAASVTVGSKTGMVKVGRLAAGDAGIASEGMLVGVEPAIRSFNESGRYEQAKLSKIKWVIMISILCRFLDIFPRGYYQPQIGWRHYI
jgi:hypothetical protein